jgi:hypothetical protein
MGAKNVLISRLRPVLRSGLAFGGAWALKAGRPAALPLAVLAIYAAGSWCLWQYAAHRAVPPAAAETDARGCPWLAPADVAYINICIQFPADSSLLQRDICRRVAVAYQANPWVERVVAVRRRFPDKFEVDLVIRRPVAYVDRSGTYYLVDAAGYRLPVNPVNRPGAEYPVIEGILASPPAPGEAWNDPCLADSLRLVETLAGVLDGRGAGLRLAGLEANRPLRGAYDQRPQMIAWTASGMKIDWGSFNESRTYAFPSAAEKRAELERQLNALPDPSAVGCISVRFRSPFVRPRADQPGSMAESGVIGAIH